MRAILFILILFSNGLMAQSSYEVTSDSDPKAIEILRSIEHNFSSAKSHLIDFDFVIESPGNPNDSYQGTLLQSGEKFELDLSNQKVISDNETVWVYLKDDNELQLNDADFGDDGEYMSPSTIYSLYKSKDFVFAIANQTVELGNAITQIEGKPIDSDSEYSKVRLTLEDKGHKVKRLKIFLKDGSRMIMQILDHKKNVELLDTNFTFDESKYENIIVEDLRF